MVARAVAQQQLENAATRHAVSVLEVNFEHFYKAQFGIRFHEREPGDQKGKTAQPENRGSKDRTRERPILVEEDLSESRSHHNEEPVKGAVKTTNR